VRGTNSNHVKVRINGIDVSDPTNPNRSLDFGQLLTADIAQKSFEDPRVVFMAPTHLVA